MALPFLILLDGNLAWSAETLWATNYYVHAAAEKPDGDGLVFRFIDRQCHHIRSIAYVGNAEQIKQSTVVCHARDAEHL